MTELEKKVRVKILKTVLNRSDKTYAKQALDYINELEEQLHLHGVVASLPSKDERSYRKWVEDECIDLKNGELIYKEKRYSEEKIWQKWYYDDI